MPFGKFKGYEIRDLPDNYLGWLYEIVEPGYLADCVYAEYQHRFGEDFKSAPPRVREIIEAGFKALALKYHPDVGGSGDAMREIIEARAWLQSLVRGHGGRDT